MCLQTKVKHTSAFSKYCKNLISPAIHWTQMCGPQLKGKWNSSQCCTACHHKKWSECRVGMRCEIKCPCIYTTRRAKYQSIIIKLKQSFLNKLIFLLIRHYCITVHLHCRTSLCAANYCCFIYKTDKILLWWINVTNSLHTTLFSNH